MNHYGVSDYHVMYHSYERFYGRLLEVIDEINTRAYGSEYSDHPYRLMDMGWTLLPEAVRVPVQGETGFFDIPVLCLSTVYGEQAIDELVERVRS